MVEGQKFKVIFHFWLHKTDSRQYYTLKKKQPCTILPTPFRAEIHLNLVYVLWGRVLDSFLSLYRIYWLSNIYQDPPFPMNAVVTCLVSAYNCICNIWILHLAPVFHLPVLAYWFQWHPSKTPNPESCGTGILSQWAEAGKRSGDQVIAEQRLNSIHKPRK